MKNIGNAIAKKTTRGTHARVGHHLTGSNGVAVCED